MARKRYFQFCLAVVALATAADAAPPPAAVQNMIREKIGSELKDPMSAQYRWPDYKPSSAGYCGFVNAKNSYGGYNGFKPYFAIVTGDAKKGYRVSSPIIASGPDDMLYDYVRDSCKSLGVDINSPPVK